MISIDLNEEDEKFVKKYAEMHNVSLSELFISTVIERIEDEMDIKAYEEAIAEYKKDPVTYTLEEVEKELLK
jgi:hypothetical protein